MRGAEPGDGEAGDQVGDAIRRIAALGAEPLSSPVERAEKGACGDRRVLDAERAGGDAFGDESADAALVAIALGDDDLAEPAGKGIDLEVRGRSFDLVDQAQHVGGGELTHARRQRPAIAPRRRQRAQEPIERSILAEEEQLVLPAKVMIEIAVGQVGGDGDVAHAGGAEPPFAERARRRFEDVDPPRLRAS